MVNIDVHMYMNLFFHHRLLLLCMTILQWFQNIFEVAYLVKWQDATPERFWPHCAFHQKMSDVNT